MKKIVKTSELPELIAEGMAPDVALWIYNGFDTMAPLEIHAAVEAKMSPNQKAYYEFEMNLAGPALSMMWNGVLVDQHYRTETILTLEAQVRELEQYVQSMSMAIWGRGLNVKSPTQMKALFYEEETGFKLTPKYSGTGKSRRISTDRKCLEAISKEHYYAQPLIAAILATKDISKQLEFLHRGVEDDGRVHCTFNVAATESGRWSSSHNPWRRGGNFQNQAESIRRIYISDPGWVFAYPDLPQAEARGVAYYSGDKEYIRAVESDDLHTIVAKLVFPELPWRHDNGPLDRAVANTLFYRTLTHRDISKRGAHGSNYGGQAFTISAHLNVPEAVGQEFQDRYFDRFSGVPEWQKAVQIELQSFGKLTNALGRERVFFGRLDSRETLKEALAWYPQSLISDILKIGMLRVWREFEMTQEPVVRLHADMHDGLLMSIREDHLDAVVPHIKRLMTVPVAFPAGTMTMVPDFAVGYQWQKKLMPEWRPGIMDTIKRPEAKTLLDVEASLFG